MNQIKYRNWVRESFIPAVKYIVGFHGGNVPFTTRELAKELRLAVGDRDYLDAGATLLVADAQKQYRAVINDYHPSQCQWLFFEFGDRLSRALNTAVEFGLVRRTLISQVLVKQCNGRTILRNTYTYSLK